MVGSEGQPEFQMRQLDDELSDGLCDELDEFELDELLFELDDELNDGLCDELDEYELDELL